MWREIVVLPIWVGVKIAHCPSGVLLLKLDHFTSNTARNLNWVQTLMTYLAKTAAFEPRFPLHSAAKPL